MQMALTIVMAEHSNAPRTEFVNCIAHARGCLRLEYFGCQTIEIGIGERLRW